MCLYRPATPSPHRCNGCSTAAALPGVRRNMPTSMPDGRADLIMQSGDNGFYVSLSTGSSFTAPAHWVQHGGSFTAGQAQYADVNGDGRFDLLFQASDNKEYLSLSSGSNFGAPTLVADFGAYGPFQPGTLHV